jgi:hypothetical protein
VACAACVADERCDKTAGSCVCDATTCPNGCCDGGGQCVPYAGQADNACGEAGAACMACEAGQTCGRIGKCTCTPDSCDGWCNGASCEPFETIASDLTAFPASRGIALVGADVYWTNLGAGSVQRRVAGKSVETLLSNNQDLEQIVVGTHRLFVRSSSFLYVESTKFDGSDVRTDAQLAYSIRFHLGRLYYGTSSGTQLGIFSHSEANPDDATQDYIIDFSDEPNVGDIAFSGSQPVYGVNFTAGAGSYDIGEPLGATGSGSSFFGSKAGRLEHLECDAAHGYYWLRTTSSAGVADLVMQHESGTDETAITTNVNVTDFTLSESDPDPPSFTTRIPIRPMRAAASACTTLQPIKRTT